MGGAQSKRTEFDGGVEFGDGTVLRWNLGFQPLVETFDGEKSAPLDDAHANMRFSDGPIVLLVEFGESLPRPKRIRVSAPATCGKIVTALAKFHARVISDRDRAIMERRGEPSLSWRGKLRSVAEFRKRIVTYADLRGDYTAYGGLSRSDREPPGTAVPAYMVHWDS